MGMKSKSKATSWEYDGRKGKKYSKKQANKYERREIKKLIDEYINNKV